MKFRALLIVAALALFARPLKSQELGVIDFSTSGNAAAQPLFIKGVLLMHGFEYDAAREAFNEAEKADPGFAMAYWGEAMTFNHPIWQETSPDLGKSALARLAATAAARLAKAPTEKEKAWIGAVEKLYGTGDKSARDTAYADAMKRMAEKYTDDLEVKAFYALALLGTSDGARAGKAMPVLESVLAKNANHPGALLYAICANDTPAHADAALRYAETYVKVGPESARGLHIASHPYAAFGKWEDVSTLNEHAGKDFDSQVWLVYSYTQQGRYNEARDVLSQIDAAARESGSAETRSHLALARAEWLIETRKWADARQPMPNGDLPKNAAAAELFAIGFAGTRSGNRAQAATAMQLMAQLMEEATVNLAPVRTVPGTPAKPGIAPIAPGPKAVNPPGITPIRPDLPPQGPTSLSTAVPGGDRRIPQVMAQQLEAAMIFSEGRREEALVLARQGGVVESLLPVEFGPPSPVKPVQEQVGEMLLDLRRYKEAMEAFQLVLKRYPRRALSLLGLARAATLARDPAAAQAAYSDLKEVWKRADPALPELKEIATALGPKPSSR